MFTRLLIVPIVMVAMLTGAMAQEPKPKASPADKPAADVDRRLAEMEDRVAALLKEVQGLRQEVKALNQAKQSGKDVKVFALKHADATDTANLLLQLLGRDGQLKIAPEPRTNQLIVSGGADVTQLIEAILVRVDVAGDAKGGIAPNRTGREPASKQVLNPSVNWKERLKELESAADVLRERAEWAQRMAKKGFMSQAQAVGDEKNLRQALELLDKAKEEFRRLTGDEKKPNPEVERPKK